MKTKLLYHGPLWKGSTSLQRAEAFAALPNISVIYSDSNYRVGKIESLYRRIRWKLRWPVDITNENRMLLERVTEYCPDIVIIDSSKVMKRSTQKKIRKVCDCRLVYYIPDDVMGKHNLSHTLRWSFPDWDVFFTTKTFNVEELFIAGTRHPVLVGKSFDPAIHSPMSPDEVGEEYEAFDCVFIGTYEKERCNTINAIAEAGLTVVVYGSDKGNWAGKELHHRITLRPSVYSLEYRRCYHYGKIALCFLRKINRDKITQRSMEIPAMGRPMLAEKTEEHDEHFIDGKEYIGFRNDEEAVRVCKFWLKRDKERIKVGLSSRTRCLNSGYSSLDRAKFMIDKIMPVNRFPDKANEKILFVGDLSLSGRTKQRFNALSDLGVAVTPVSYELFSQKPGISQSAAFLNRIFNKLGWPLDNLDVNKRIIQYLKYEQVNILWIEKALMLKPKTLQKVKEIQPNIKLIFCSEDDMYAKHNQSQIGRAHV